MHAIEPLPSANRVASRLGGFVADNDTNFGYFPMRVYVLIVYVLQTGL